MGHSDVVRCVAWLPDGKLRASGGRDETLRFWDTRTWAESGALDHRHETGLLAIAFSPQGTYLASVGYNPNGTLDDSFGIHGRVAVDFNSTNDSARGVVPQPDGGIVGVSSSTPGGSPAFAAVRLHSDGSLDDSFGDAITKLIGDVESFGKAMTKLTKEPTPSVIYQSTSMC